MKEKIKQALESRTRFIVNDEEFKESAVLIPIFEKDGECYIVFTQRTDHLENHSGQISFPGGGRHKEDRDLQETALRESREEIGLKEEDVEILGVLDDAITETTYFRITPFVGLIPYPYQFHPDPYEVREIFSVSIDALVNKAKITVEDKIYGDKKVKIHTFAVDGRVIWGATALILSTFFDIIGAWNGARCNS